MGELAREGMDNLVATQKKFLDIIVEETTKATKAVKTPAKPVEKTELGELTKHSAEAFLEAQKKLLEIAGKQMEANVETAGKAVGRLTAPAGTAIGDVTRQSVENFVAAQKALFDVMVKPAPAKGAAKEHREAAKHARAR